MRAGSSLSRSLDVSPLAGWARFRWVPFAMLGLATLSAAPAGATIGFEFLDRSLHDSDAVVMDQNLGIAGLRVEDFEDSQLERGFTLTIANGAAAAAQQNGIYDFWTPFMTRFAGPDGNPGQFWDGTGIVAVQTGTVTVDFDVPVSQFGIGISGYVGDAGEMTFSVNGATSVMGDTLEASGSLTHDNTGRNTYLRITATDGDVIERVSLEILVTPADGGTLDHMAFAPRDLVVAHDKISQDDLAGELESNDSFGNGIAAVGPVDAGATVDLAVGAEFDDDGGSNSGAVWLLFRDGSGGVTGERKIAANDPAFGGALGDEDRFGHAIAPLGNLDGALAPDIAVGTPPFDDDGSNAVGAVWILFLDTDGSIASHTQITASTHAFATPPAAGSRFGQSVANLGDFDGNGVDDLVVGGMGDALFRGAVWILLLDANGGVLGDHKIAPGTLDPGDQFGVSVAGLGDVDGDGVLDVAVGANEDDDGGTQLGVVWLLFLNADGTVKTSRQIGSSAGVLNGLLDTEDKFGTTLAALGDLTGDGISELAVGAPLDDDGATDQGAVWVLSFNAAGVVIGKDKISAQRGGFDGLLDPSDAFGAGLGLLASPSGTDPPVLGVGATSDDDGMTGNRGALWLLDLNADALFDNCRDAVDNDGDTLVDFPEDPGCLNASWTFENPQCNDGVDNDAMEGTDFDGTPPDPECVGAPSSNSESPVCGLGGEVAIALMFLGNMRRRRRAATPAGASARTHARPFRRI